MAGASLSHGRDFSQRQSINRRAERAESPFEFGLWKIGPSRTGVYIDLPSPRLRRRGAIDKAPIRSDKIFDPLKVIELVSRDVQNTVRLKRTMN